MLQVRSSKSQQNMFSLMSKEALQTTRVVLNGVDGLASISSVEIYVQIVEKDISEKCSFGQGAVIFSKNDVMSGR